MSAAVITTLLTVVGGLLAAAASYWFTKKREREAEWRKEKLAQYKLFVESLSGVIEGESYAEGQRAFAKACNSLQLFAPQRVIVALGEFRDEIRTSNMSRSLESHDRLLARLLFEIRRDLDVSPADDLSTFKGGTLKKCGNELKAA